MQPPPLEIISATGLQLAARLTRLVGQLLENQVPPATGRAVSATLDCVEAKARRQAALEAATVIVSRGQRLTLTQTARRISAALLLFQRYGQIVVSGFHQSELEAVCAVLLATRGPIYWRRIYDELKRLSYHRQSKP